MSDCFISGSSVWNALRGAQLAGTSVCLARHLRLAPMCVSLLSLGCLQDAYLRAACEPYAAAATPHHPPPPPALLEIEKNGRLFWCPAPLPKVPQVASSWPANSSAVRGSGGPLGAGKGKYKNPLTDL